MEIQIIQNRKTDQEVAMTTKITYFITSLNFGGAEIGMARLIDGIKESNRSDEFDITVVSLVKTSRDVVDLFPDSVTVHNLDIGRVHEIWKVKPLWEELRETDILVCSLYHASVLGVLLGSLQSVPQILTWQHNSEYRNQTAQRLYGLCYHFSDNVLADSQAVKKMLLSEFKLPPSKVSVLPIAGVDTDVFTPGIGSIEFDNDQSIQIGTVGRLIPQKGYDYLLECADRLEEAHFHIIGEGELEEELHSAVEQENLENVSLHGKVSYEALPEYLASFDIYFQPSRYEGLCMTVIEAMSVGLPVVATRTGGIQESVVDMRTGYLVEPGNIKKYTFRLRILINNSVIRKEFAKNGRSRVLEAYSKKAFCSGFFDVMKP